MIIIIRDKVLVVIKGGFPVIGDIDLQLLPDLVLQLQRDTDTSQLLTEAINPGTQLLHEQRRFLEVQINNQHHVLEKSLIQDHIQ